MLLVTSLNVDPVYVYSLESDQAKVCSQLCKNREDGSHCTWVGEKFVQNPEIPHKKEWGFR